MDQDGTWHGGMGLGPGHIVLDWDPAALTKKVAQPRHRIFGPCFLWPNGWMDQDATRAGQHCVRCCLALSPRGTALPSSFGPCSQTAGWIKMTLGTKVGLSPGDFVFDGDPALLPKKGAQPPPQFSAHVYCGQRAGWIKMALDTEVSLGPGHIVLDGEPAPLPKNGVEPPQFSAHFYCRQTAG